MLDAMLLAGTRLADVSSILMILAGATMGVIFGALPGLGSVVALAIALPFTFGMDPMLAMFLYAGIMSSVTFGGSVPAILLNTPGTPPNAATCFDGYPMAQRGEGARAISISATSCFVGSVGGAVITIALLPAVKPIVFAFGPPEFFWLVAFGLVMIAFAAKGNMVKGLIGGGVGVMLSMIGFSDMFGAFRFTMGSDYLWDGIPLVPFVVGVFAVSELINYSSRGGSTATTDVSSQDMDWRHQTLQGVADVLKRPIVWMRSAAIGSGIGIIPGLGGGVAAFMSYVVGMQRTKEPELYGRGSVEGIIASETANDAKDGGALLPTVAFGIPGSPDTAILLGAFILHGLQPGPVLLRDNLDLVYALLFGIVVSQVATSGIGFLSAPLLARISVLKSRWIAPFVLTLVIVGTYMLRANILDVAAAITAGYIGYVLRRYGYPLITIAIGFILGPLAEKSFLQSMLISDGNFIIFYKEPISLILMILTLGTLAVPLVSAWRKRGQKKSREPAPTDRRPRGLFRGPIICAVLLAAAILAALFNAQTLPAEVQLMPVVFGTITLALLVLDIAGEVSPAVARWTAPALTDMWNNSSSGTDEAQAPERPAPWGPVLRVIAMIATYFLLVYTLGLYAVPVIAITAYLVFQAAVKLRYALLAAIISSVIVVISMQLLRVDVWTGVVSEIIPGYLGGAISPDL